MDKNNLTNLILQSLEQGKSQAEILAMYLQQEKELAEILPILNSLFSLPRKQTPEPARQRKYLFAPEPKSWLAWLHITKIVSVSTSLILLISTIVGTAYATFNSLPGSKLFSVKKAAENSRLILAFSDQEKAKVQVELAQKRLTEAKKIFSDPNANLNQEKAAITELVEQTKSAIAVTNKAVAISPLPEKTTQAVTSLENITKQQTDLLSQVKPSAPVAKEASQALAQSKEVLSKVADLKKYIEVASKEENLVVLTGKVKITGIVNKVDLEQNNFLIEKQEVFWNASTTISGSSTTNITVLKDKIAVEVIAQKIQEKLVALQINVLMEKPETSDGRVKGESTSTEDSILPSNVLELISSSTVPSASSASSTVISASSTKKNLIRFKKDEGESENNLTNEAKKDPNQASTGYIIEDPAPMYQE